MKTQSTILQATADIKGNRFTVKAGELRNFIYIEKQPEIVALALEGDFIDWGGAMVREYKVLYHGYFSKMPEHLREALKRNGY